VDASEVAPAFAILADNPAEALQVVLSFSAAPG